MKRKITIRVDYEKTDLTSYEIYDWVENTFGDKEVKPLTEEIRTSNGTLTHIEFVIMDEIDTKVDLPKTITQTSALQDVVARWKCGFAFDEDSDEDVALLEKAEDELSLK